MSCMTAVFLCVTHTLLSVLGHLLKEITRLHHKHTVLLCVAVDLSGVRVRGHEVGPSVLLGHLQE